MNLPQPEVVASVKRPESVSDQVRIIEAVESVYGPEVSVREEPMGWLQFSLPAVDEMEGRSA